jgi:hypothetical protein
MALYCRNLHALPPAIAAAMATGFLHALPVMDSCFSL